ncbi:MAG TPA: hypothetical protein VLK22_00005 [Candidatus Udaeobacter sp.]|nr:hypothetical protein [Candidatus Udaeobacter sp.]
MLKSPTEIIVDSWNLYKKNWRGFLPFIIMLFLPTLILSAIGTISLYLSVYLPSAALFSNIIIMLVFAASMVFAIWVTTALARTILDSLVGNQIKWKETFSTSSALIWPVILVSLLITLSVIGGTLLLIIPGIIFAVWYTFASYAVILDGAKGLNALRASKALVVGRWWAVAGRILFIALVFGVLNAALTYPLIFLIKMIPLPTFIQSASAAILSVVINSFTAPLSAGATIILYQSAKQNPVVSTALPPQI